MSNPKLVVIISVVAVLSASLGVVVTSRMAPKEVKVSLDLGDGKSLDMTPLLDVPAGGMEAARKKANENAAIATLRSLAAAQAQMQAAALIDTDGDEGGEYAYFSEMAGTAALRGSGEPIDIQLLPTAFGNVSSDGTMQRQGYVFRIDLPAATVAGKTAGLHEGARVQPDGDNAEILWSAYAWPQEAGTSGTRAFFINHEGDVLECPNSDRTYDGRSKRPAFDAAIRSEHPRDMAGPLPLFDQGHTTNDGLGWSPVTD